MANVTPKVGQADLHLIEFSDGTKVLVDAGEGGDDFGVGWRFLQERKIDHVAAVVISHFHQDHYGMLLSYIESGLRVDRVYANLPHKSLADYEKGWGCDWDHVQATLAKLRQRGIPVILDAKAGDRIVDLTLADGTKAGLEIICLYDGVNTPPGVGRTDVNDTSIILRLYHGQTRALFTGDLNHTLGAYLASANFDVKADLLKAPHHGTEGAAPDEFFDRVGAKAVLVPSPQILWESPRSRRIRNYFLSRHIPIYVAGVHGHVTATLTPHGFDVTHTGVATKSTLATP